MDKIKAQIINNNLDGFSEIKIVGDIGKYDGSYLANQIDTLYNRQSYEATAMLRIRINSFGGDVRSGFSIVSAMQRFMDAGGTIETINEGCADSSAGWIAACGTRGKRRVMQFATGFLHAPMFADGRTLDDVPDGSAEKAVLKDNFDKLINIFVSATGKSFARVKELMENSTELSASELVSEGFADEIVEVNNAPRIKNGASRAEIVNLTDNIEIEIKQKKASSERINIINMKKINEILNLNAEASEGAIQEAVTKVINAKTKADADLLEMTGKHDAAVLELANLKKEAKAEKDAEVINYVEELIKLDKRNEEKKESLINMAQADFDTFKSIMPLKKAIVNGEAIDKGIEEEDTQGDKDAKTQGIKNAKEFAGLSHEKREELKNSDSNKYADLTRDYDKYAIEII